MRRSALMLAALGWPSILAAAPQAGVLPPAPRQQESTVVVVGPVLPDAPTDKDERGLWMQADEAERRLKASNFVIADPALNAYVRGVLCREVGERRCVGARIYITRTPYFNASMMPNGAMQVWSGLFLRVRDEAQLAAVLGHEFVHYQDRHSVKQFREIKGKTNAIAWMSILPVGGLVGGAIGLAQLGMIGSVYGFSRDQERAADAGSVTMLAAAGYDPMAAARIWQQVRAEQDAGDPPGHAGADGRPEDAGGGAGHGGERSGRGAVPRGAGAVLGRFHRRPDQAERFRRHRAAARPAGGRALDR